MCLLWTLRVGLWGSWAGVATRQKVDHPFVSLVWALASALVKRDWEPDELIAHWTPVEDDWRLLGNKTGATRLGSR